MQQTFKSTKHTPTTQTKKNTTYHPKHKHHSLCASSNNEHIRKSTSTNPTTHQKNSENKN